MVRGFFQLFSFVTFVFEKGFPVKNGGTDYLFTRGEF